MCSRWSSVRGVLSYAWTQARDAACWKAPTKYRADASARQIIWSKTLGSARARSLSCMRGRDPARTPDTHRQLRSVWEGSSQGRSADATIAVRYVEPLCLATDVGLLQTSVDHAWKHEAPSLAPMVSCFCLSVVKLSSALPAGLVSFSALNQCIFGYDDGGAAAEFGSLSGENTSRKKTSACSGSTHKAGQRIRTCTDMKSMTQLYVLGNVVRMNM